MNSGSDKTKSRILKIVFLLITIIAIILLLLRGCNKGKETPTGIKIININEKVDSFNDDTIFIKEDLLPKEYVYNITIHNYLDEDYYLYKEEITNENIKFEKIIEYLPSGKDIKIKFKIKPTKKITDDFKIKFYYGKLKEVKVGDETIASYGEDKIKIPTPKEEKEGFKIIGYTDLEGSQIVKYKINEDYVLKDGTVLYPIYEEINPSTGPSDNTDDNSGNNSSSDVEEVKKYTVTFDYKNGQPSTSKVVEYKAPYGDLPGANKEGYTFDGWYLDGKEIFNTTIVDINHDVTLEAKYTIIKYGIKYNLDGGKATNPSYYTIESDTFTLELPTKTGSAFVGWTGSNGSNPEKIVVIEKGSKGAREYTANYSENEKVAYKVIHRKQKLDETYEDGEVEDKEAPYGSLVTPAVKEYTGFEKPATKTVEVKQDGNTEIEYLYNRKMFKLTLSDTDDINLDLSTPAGTYPYETEITLVAKDKDGYNFTGWSNGSEGKEITFKLTDNLNIRPTYEAKTYRIVFNSNGSEGVMADQVVTYDEEVTLKSNEFTKVGNDFIGWNTKDDGTGETFENNATVKNLTTEESITIYAQFIPHTYTINFDTKGGSSKLPTTRRYKEAFGNLGDASKTGYTFTGWYLGETKILEDMIYESTSDITLEARYEVITYHITYNLDDGTAENPDTYTIETDTFTLNNPTKTGFNFSGWTGSNGENLQTSVTIEKGSTGDKTYTAHYSESEQTAYKVLHKYQNYDLESYTEVEETLYGATGSTVTPALKERQGFISPSLEELYIKADGTAKLTYIYQRDSFDFSYSNTEDIDLDNSTEEGTYLYETEITVVAKDKDGYTFTGWSNGETEQTATFSLSGDLNIYPIYEANTYTIVFNPTSGTGSMSDQEMTYDVTASLNKNLYTKTGYIFDGWNTKEDLTGNNYADEAEVKNLATSGNVILYAKWKAREDTPYKVIHKIQKLSLDGYDEETENLVGKTDDEITPSVREMTGFTKPSAQTTTIKADGTTTVTYTYNREMYDLSFDDNEDMTSNKEEGSYPYGTSVTVTAKEKDGYTFEGWSNGSEENPYTFNLSGDITITPIYSANTDTPYKVVHKIQKLSLDGYDEEVENLVGTTDENVTPAVREMTGFTKPSAQTVKIKGDGSTTVTYTYNREMYDLSFDDNEYVTSNIPAGEYPYGTEVTLTAADRDGYTFVEWSNGENDNPYTFSLSKDVTLTPIYTANTDTPYKVIHKKQKVTLDGYDIAETENLEGTTGHEVTPAVKEYTGFTAPATQTKTIAGNGSTEIVYEYTRNIYQLTIEEPDYVVEDKSGEYPFGAEVTLEAKDRQGYDFAGWSTGETTQEITITIGTEDISTKPLYTGSNTTLYKVKHHYMKLTSGYDEEIETFTGTTGQTVVAPIKSKTGFVNPESQNITITADGEAFVTYEYERENYSFSISDRTYLDIMSSPNGSYPYETEIYVKAVEREGYDFKWSDNVTDYERTFNLEGNVTDLTLVYTAREDTPYKVIHKTQKIDESYEERETENLVGTTGQEVTPAVKDYTGFTAPSTETKVISGDGSTEFIYEYTRNKYQLTIEDSEYLVGDKSGEYYYGEEVTLEAVDRQGYIFVGWSTGETTKEITITIGAEDVTTKPLYTESDDTTYKVIHRYAKLTSGYDEVIVNGVGTTGQTIEAPLRSSTGFVNPTKQNITITADGLASVTYVYERETYSFSVADRTYLENGSTANGTYPYETEITLIAAERAGYDFKWSDDITDYERTFSLTEGKTLSLIYTPREDTPYKVIHKTQKIDESYEIREIENLVGTTGSEITPSVKTYEGFTSPSTQTTTINGNGNTEVVYEYTRNKYQLTIGNSQYVEEDKSGEYYYGEEVTIKAKDREGYTFAGWSTGEESKQITITIGTSDITTSPLYTANDDTTYKVIHKYARLTSGYDEVIVNGVGTTGSTIEAPLRPSTGFINPAKQNITITADGLASITYTYERETYSFSISDRTYLENGSTANGTYPYGTEITLIAAEREGYTFSWSDNVTDYERTFTLTEAKTLSLVYTANTYEVIFNKNNESATGEMANEEFSYGELKKLTKNTYSLAGYTFSGWNTLSTGTGDDYSDEEEVSNLTSVNNGVVNLYAVWTPRNDTPYRVIHQKQKLTLDGYDTEETENLVGTTGQEVTPAVKTYTGFTSPSTQTVTILGNGNTTVTYSYNREMYNFVLGNTEDVTSTKVNGSYPYGTEITITANDKAGYIFTEWSNGETNNPYTFTLTSNLTITPVYAATTYTVTFDANGGAGDMSPQTITKDVATKLTKNIYTKSSSIFASWNTEADGSGTTYYDEEEITRNTDLYLYAMWAPSTKIARIGNTYYDKLALAIAAVPTTGAETEVVLLQNTSEKITIDSTKNVKLNLQGNTLSNSGTDGTSNVIVNNGKLELFDGNITSTASAGAINNNSTATLTMTDVNLTATGSKQAIYNDGGTLTINEGVYLSSTSTQRAALHNKTNGTVNILGGTIISTNLYAIYNENGSLTIGTKDGIVNSTSPVIQGKTYGIVANSTYNFYDGIIKGKTYHVGTATTGNTPTVANDTNETKINEIEDDAEKVISTEDISGVTYRILYCTIDSNKISVNFDANGGTVSTTSKKISIGDKIGELPIPTKDHCTFDGWYTEKNGGIKINTETKPTETTTYYAHWIEDTHYTITFDHNNETGETTVQKVYDGDSIGELPELYYSNHVFDGWYTESSGGTKIDSTYTPTNDIRVYAHWKQYSFQRDSWEDIIADYNNGEIEELQEAMEIGATREIELDLNNDGTPETKARLRIANLSTPNECFEEGYSQTACGFVIEFSDIISKHRINPYNSSSNIAGTNSYGGWQYSDMRAYLNSTLYEYENKNYSNSGIYNSLPNDLKNKIIDTTVISSHGPDENSNFTTTDKLYLLAKRELDGYETSGYWDSSSGIKYYDTAVSTTRQLDYYQNHDMMKQDLDGNASEWWTRTVYNFYSTAFYAVTKNPSRPMTSETSITSLYGVSPAFRISKSTYTVKFDANGGTVTNSTKEVIKGGTVGTLPVPVSPTGRAFEGWYTGLDTGIKVDENYTINGDVTLYAHWGEAITKFETGELVNIKMKNLSSNSTSATSTSIDSLITTFTKSSSRPDSSIMVSGNNVATEDSDYPIYMWYSNGTIYWWSEASTVYFNSDTSNFFYRLSKITNISFNGINTSKLTKTNHMFDGCNTLTSLDLSNFDTSNVTAMSYMFRYCSSLTSLNLSSFNTSNVILMEELFYDCESLSSLVLGNNFDTSKVMAMYGIFYNCSSLTSLNLGNKFDTSNVTSMNGMFSNCSSLTSLNLGDKFDTSKVTNMHVMFCECSSLTSLDLGDRFYTSNVTTMEDMFYNCSSLTTIDLGDNFDTSKVTTMYRMFRNCSSLTSLDLENKFNTSKVTTMEAMFYDCLLLTSLDLGDNFDTSDVRTMKEMFYNCSSLTSLDLGDKYDTSKVKTMTGMFRNCYSLTSLDLGDNFDTSLVNSMSYMFSNCYVLPEINLGNKFDTSTVESTAYMFERCHEIKSLNLGNKFDTSNVIYMSSMFDGCYNLTSIDVTGFNTSNVYNMSRMFAGCINLTEIDISSFNTSNVVSIGAMFDSRYYDKNHNIVTNESSKLKRIIGLTSLDVSNISNTDPIGLNYMFYGCANIEYLDLSSFKTSTVTAMYNMFYGCKKLKKIYATSDFVTTAITSSNQDMFYNCLELEGGMGTTYSYSNRYHHYAHLDGGSSNPGYFTEKSGIFIEYNANGATGEMATQTIPFGTSANLNTNTFFRNQYLFIGWNTKPNGTGTSYEDEASVEASLGDKNIILYAQWIRNGWNFENESEFDETGEPLTDQKWSYYRNGIKVENELIYANGSITPGVTSMHHFLIQDGYVYLGWYEENGDHYFFSWFDKNNNGYVDAYRFESTTQMIGNRSYTFDANGVCTDYDEESSYIITFDPNGGTLDTTEKGVPKGSRIGTLPIPTKENETLGGWYTERDGGTKIETTTVPTAHTTYYAHYIPSIDQATITPSSIEIKDTETATITVTGPNNMEGYTFSSSDDTVATVDQNGLVSGVSGGTATITITGNNSGIVKTVDVTIIAPTNYTINYDSNGGSFDGNNPNINTINYSVYPTNTINYSHTANIDDAGNRNGNYANNLATKHVITIPGADSVHVTLTYGTENNYDMVYIFKGEYTGNVTKKMSAGQLYTYMGGSNSTSTVEFDVEGDTVTFAFYSDGGAGYYGYYAVVTGIGDYTQDAEYSEPTRNNKVFDSWNTSADGSGTSYRNEKEVLIDIESLGNTTLYAQWNYTLTYDFNDANNMSSWKFNGEDLFNISYDNSTGLNDITVNGQSGIWENVYIPVKTVSGKTYTIDLDYYNPNGFIGYSSYTGIPLTVYGSVPSNSNPGTGIAQKYLLKEANPDIQHISLTFTANNATSYISFNFGCAADGKTTNVQIGNIKIKQDLAGKYKVTNIPTLQFEEGIDFAYYTAKVNGEILVDNTTTISSDTTYYGIIDRVNYKIKFDANGGSGSMGDLNMEYGIPVYLPYNEFTYSDYGFAGWNTAPDGSGTSYLDCQKVNKLTIEEGKVITLYAQWLPAEATFDTGSNVNSKLTSLAGEKANITSIEKSDTKPTRANMTSANNIAAAISNIPIYAWYEDGTIYWWTQDDDPELNTDSSSMFSGFTSVETIDLDTIKSTNTTTMQGMFLNCSSLTTLDLSNFRGDSLLSTKSMFSGCTSLASLDLTDFNMNYVTDMSSMFNNCISLTSLDLSDALGGSVTSMYYMFAGCTNLEILNISNLDMSHISSVTGIFNGTTKLKTIIADNSKYSNTSITMYTGKSSIETISLRNASVGTATSMYWMFSGDSGLKNLDLTNFDTSGVTNMGYVFSSCSSLTSIDVSSFDTSSVTYMQSMFSGTSSLVILDLRNFDTSNVTDMQVMFQNMTSLTTIYASTMFNVDSVSNSANMFSGDTVLVGGAGTVFDSSHIDKEYAHIDGGIDNPGYFTDGNVTVNTISFDANGGTGSMSNQRVNLSTRNRIKANEFTNEGYAFIGWNTERDGSGDGYVDRDYIVANRYNNDVTLYAQWVDPSSAFDTGINVNVKLKKLSGTSSPSYGTSNTNISSFVRSNTKPDISSMTNDNIISTSNSLVPIYAWFDNGTIYYWTEAVTPELNKDSSNMFNRLSSIQSVDLSTVDTSEVKNMSNMFYDCTSITSLDLSNFETSNVTDMSNMFRECNALTSLNISSFNTSNVTDMSDMFGSCSSLESVNLSNFNTSKVTNMNYMFIGCSSLTSLDLSNFRGNELLYAASMFRGCTNLSSINLTGFNMPKVKAINEMFHSCSNLETIDLSSLSPSSVETMGSMFNDCTSLKTLNMSDFDMTNVTNAYWPLPNSLTVETIIANNIVFNDNTIEIFNQLHNLKSISLNNASLGSSTTIANMFAHDSSLESIDISSFDTSNITDMSGLFFGCESLTEIDLHTFNTNNVTNMSGMFSYCYNLTDLDISSFNTSQVINMSGMFRNSSSITELDLSHFDTSKVETMEDMFDGMTTLETINLSSFDTTKVTTMKSMFKNCEALTELDLSTFDTSLVTNMYSMFGGCENLTTIKASNLFTVENVENASVFYGSTSLVGGAGTTYDVVHTDKEYARIDEGSSNPGYFTLGGVNVNKITYNANGGTGEMANQQVDLTVDNTLVSNVFTRTNYLFVGWNTSADGSGDAYVEGATILANTYSGNITLYAQWIEATSTFDSGKNFNSKIKKLSGTTIASYDSNNTNITSIVRSNTKPDTSTMTSDNIISTINSNVPIYAWYDNGTIYWWTEAEKPYLNEDSSYMFNNLFSATTIQLNTIDTINVTNMNSMFGSCSSLVSIDLSSFDTSSVTNMIGMFGSCHSLVSLDLSNFRGNELLTASSMFDSNSMLSSINLTGFNTPKITKTEYMFRGCNSLTELDLSSFDTSNVTDMTQMFYNCQNLKTINVSSLFNVDNVLSSDDMFCNDYSLIGGSGTPYHSSAIDKTYAHIDGGVSNPGYFTDASSIYEITLDANGGTISTQFINVNIGSEIGTIPTPTAPAGKEFMGWFTGVSDGTEVTSTYIPSNNMTIYAHYNDLSYTVSFNTDGGTAVANQTITYNELVTRPIVNPIKENKVFVGWYADSNLETVFDFENTHITSDTTIYAKWRDPDKICKRAKQSELHKSGGTTYGQIGTEGVLSTGDAFICDINGDGVYNATNEMFYYVSNYFDTSSTSFDNDYAALIYYNDYDTERYLDTVAVNQKPSVQFVDALPSTSSWSNVSLHKTTRTVYDYALNGRLYAAYQGDVTYSGKAARLLTYRELGSCLNGGGAPAPLKTSCNFLYENTDSRIPFWLETVNINANSNHYGLAIDQSNHNLVTRTLNYIGNIRPVIDMPINQIDLSYQDVKYTVTFDTDGGSSVASQEIIEGGKVTIPEMPTKEDHEFVGWYSDPGLTTPFDFTNTTVNSDITIYAKWFEIKELCRRATSSELHTSGGVTYGQVGTADTLTVGDAFVCDINKDGYYNPTNEMFYYVSRYFDTYTTSFDNDYAALIYYKDYDEERYLDTIANNTTPNVVFIDALPSTSTWTNVTLKDTSRTVYDYNIDGRLYAAYQGDISYSGKAARLITDRELGVCRVNSGVPISLKNNCNFLQENTGSRQSFWLETIDVNANSTHSALVVNQEYLRIETKYLHYYSGIRPTIDVAIDNMDLSASRSVSVPEEVNETEQSRSVTPQNEVQDNNTSLEEGTDLEQNTNNEEENEDTNNMSDISASIYGIISNNDTNSKFKLPKEADSLRRYFMGIY